jgi:hypothetical protein
MAMILQIGRQAIEATISVDPAKGRPVISHSIAARPRRQAIRFTAMLVSALLVPNFATAAVPPAAATTGTAGATDRAEAAGDEVAKSSPATPRRPMPNRQVKLGERAKLQYKAAWGVDKLKVQQTASGNLIRFSYRVTDPVQAKVLGEKSATPYMLGQRSRALLHIPVMDKVGPLRQSGVPVAGKEYWMTFSNKGNLVRPGDRVNVIIGSFHADGLVVE